MNGPERDENSKKKKGTNGFSKVMLFEGVPHNILILWVKKNVWQPGILRWLKIIYMMIKFYQ